MLKQLILGQQTYSVRSIAVLIKLIRSFVLINIVAELKKLISVAEFY